MFFATFRVDRRTHHGGGISLYGDGKIYITGENGNVVVLANETELKILAKNDMGDAIYRHTGHR